MKILANATAALIISLGAAQSASAGIVRVSEADFVAGSGIITFSEFALGTANPVYAPGNYGGGIGSPTVYTGGWFVGQSLSLSPGVDCPGASASACVVGSPSGPLSLDPFSPAAFIASDGAFPTSPTLSGTPLFNGPIAILFDTDQAGVGFDGGYFNAAGSTGITAFARDGSLLGTVSNTGLGIEFLGLVSDDGSNQIAGVFLDLVGAEPAGFNIDNLRFGERGQVVVPGAVPEPATWLTMILGFGLVGGAMRMQKRRERVSVRYT